MHRLVLAAAAAVALTASGCAAPSAEKSAAGGAAGGAAAKAPDTDEAKGKKALSWWQRLTRSHREPKEKPWVYGDVRPGKGLLSNDDDGFVLLRKGAVQSPGRSDKAEKVRR